MLVFNNETSASISLLNTNFKRIFKTAFIDNFGQSLSHSFFPYIKKRHSSFVLYTRAWPFFSYFNYSKAQESWTFPAT